TDWLLELGGGSRSFQRYWSRVFDSAFERRLDAWSYVWQYSYWSQGALGILPARNLVSNIGFGPDATHTRSPHSPLAQQAVEQLSLPLTHPPTLTRDAAADRWTERNIFSIKPMTETRIHYATQLREIARLTKKVLRHVPRPRGFSSLL